MDRTLSELGDRYGQHFGGFTGQCLWVVRIAPLGWRWRLYAATSRDNRVDIGTLLDKGWRPMRWWARRAAIAGCGKVNDRPLDRRRSTRSPRA